MYFAYIINSWFNPDSYRGSSVSQTAIGDRNVAFLLLPFSELGRLQLFIKICKKYTMKKMTCKQPGGACDLEFHGETFDDIANQSKKHGMDMLQKGDTAHIEAMSEMQKMMKEPSDFAKWFEAKKEEFNNLSNI